MIFDCFQKYLIFPPVLEKPANDSLSYKNWKLIFLLAYNPQIQLRLQSLFLLSKEGTSWSKQGSWDIEFPPHLSQYSCRQV